MSGTLKWGAVAVLVTAAAALCWNGNDGWGWFLLVAVLIF